MKNRTNQRLEEVTVTTLVVGMDIAKSKHWARFTDYHRSHSVCHYKQNKKMIDKNKKHSCSSKSQNLTRFV
ncbi:MAG: hypothetical protein FWF79_07030 [Defluviitaleaceae bacterium]|nr:hypothetical protein [Defluviitaleaceae bacterium]